jgi:hypothetical protein
MTFQFRWITKSLYHTLVSNGMMRTWFGLVEADIRNLQELSRNDFSVPPGKKEEDKEKAVETEEG